MIYVSENQLDQVQYLIEQSVQGNHILFYPDEIKEIFSIYRQTPLLEEEAYAMESHIEKLISLPTIAKKRTYLESLDEDTYIQVVRTYFNVIENHIVDQGSEKH